MKTRRVRDVARLFGLDLRGSAVVRPRRRVPGVPGAGSVTLVSGRSGAGKSTLLREMAEAWRRVPAVRVTCLEKICLPRDRALVDCFALPLAGTLAVLARVGLAEARLFVVPPAVLSEGEQFRYRLGAWLAGAARADVLHVLIADEFCSCLDRATARAVAWQFQKAIRAGDGIARAAVLATAHEDLRRDVAADVEIGVES